MTDHTQPAETGAHAQTADPTDLASLLADPPAGLVDRLTAMIASRLGPQVTESVREHLSADVADPAVSPVLELEVSDELLEQFANTVRAELNRSLGDLTREVVALRDRLDRIERRLPGNATAGPTRVVPGQAVSGQ